MRRRRTSGEGAPSSQEKPVLFSMPLKTLRAWMRVGEPQEREFAPLRETLNALDQLEPDRARLLAAFAYLLGRVAHADQHVSAEETAAMEALVTEEGQIAPRSEERRVGKEW